MPCTIVLTFICKRLLAEALLLSLCHDIIRVHMCMRDYPHRCISMNPTLQH